MRKRIAAVLSAALLCVLPTVGLTFAAPTANAATCPNATTKTFSTYTQIRGCMVSFDGTAIVYNLYEPLHPARHSLYTILEGPGWGSPGQPANLGFLRDGFAELTWDPRGFGQSGGLAGINRPSVEGRDVSTLIDKIITGRPELIVDQCTPAAKVANFKRLHPHASLPFQPHYYNDNASGNSCGKPVIGMEGGSYGGSIDLAVAAYDRRVKAIVPQATWNDLRYALDPNGVPKQGFLAGLYTLGMVLGTQSHLQPDAGPTDTNPTRYDPELTYALVSTLAMGYADPSVVTWLGQRSLAVYGRGPHGSVPDVPTLLMQGTEDTLFDLNNAWMNATEISAAHPGLPVKVLTVCAGHTGCPDYVDHSTARSPLWPRMTLARVVQDRTVAWLSHYLRGSGVTDGMPAPFVYQNQYGDYRPVATLPTVARPGPATIRSAPFGGMLVVNPIPAPPAISGLNTAFIDSPTNAADPGQMTIPVLAAPSSHGLSVAGIGHANFTATFTSPSVNLFFRLLDKRTGKVIDAMTEPIRLVSSGTPQKVSLDLDGLCYDLPAGDTLELQVSTSSTEFAGNRTPGTVTITDGTVRVPTLPAR